MTATAFAITVVGLYALAVAHYLIVHPILTDRLEHARNKRGDRRRRQTLHVVRARLTDAEHALRRAHHHDPDRVEHLQDEVRRLTAHRDILEHETAIEHRSRRAHRQGRPALTRSQARARELTYANGGQRGLGLKADPVRPTAYDRTRDR